jgi:UPF0716 protein FxsA
MFSLLVLLFTVVPALEIYLLFTIGAQIGGLNTLAIVIITGIVGAALAKTQGLSILQKIQGDLQRGALPAAQILHGLLVFAGGLLLLTPGFATDIFGLSMVIPGTRHIIALWLQKYFERAIANGNLHFHTSGNGFSGFSGHTQRTSSQEESKTFHKQVGPDVFEAEYTKKD